MPTTRRLARSLVCAGVLAAPTPAFAAGWVYTESNNPSPGRNSVLALDYGPAGALNPLHIREFPTRGTGAPLILGKSVGTLAGDQEVTLSPDKRWLFAVNQGSNSIAVFRVSKGNGTLTPVPGSPFSSGGTAPISIGYGRGRIVVANHGQTAPFDPAGPTPPGAANLASFSVSRAGRLRLISTVAEGPAGLIAAAVSPSGGNVFSSGFYSLKINSLTLSSRGRLAEAPGSPTQFPASMNAGAAAKLPPFIPPVLVPLPFGIAVHPSKPYVYVVGALNTRVAIYHYDRTGALSFAGQVDNTGSFAACWAIVSKDGRHLYTANSVTQDISLFDISPSGGGLTFVERVKLPSQGTVRELALDTTNRFLYASGGHDDPDGPRPQGIKPDGTIVDAPADGNFIDAFSVSPSGRLTATSSTALPVRLSQLPYGLATLRRGG